MENMAIALLLRPIIIMALGLAILNPARKAVIRWIPEGRIKRLLLLRVADQHIGQHRRDGLL